MKNRIKQFSSLNKLALKIATGSFLLGTLIFLIATINSHDVVLIAGFIFIVLAFLTNVIALMAVFFCSLLNKKYCENLFTLYCILINLPIAIGYLFIMNL